MTPVSLTERVLLALILAIGAGLRVWLLLGPFSQIDADEAVVGLMAMQLPGEVPAFYWEQHYLGTIEPLVVSALFAVAGPSAAALKLVPAAFSMVFVRLVYLMARPISGPGPALISALYLAIPPSGVYSSRDCALAAVERFRKLPGFRDLPQMADTSSLGTAEGFYLDEYELDGDSWQDGYETL